MNHIDTPADPVELLHRSLDAMDQGLATLAMHHLKELLRIRPGSAEAHYLLGMQQARVGLRGRAIASLRTALAFQPRFDAARFRLGLLLSEAGQAGEARAIWRPLHELPADDPFRLFAAGLVSLVDGDTRHGAACLRRGMALNHLNAPLNAEMDRILEGIEHHALPH